MQAEVAESRISGCSGRLASVLTASRNLETIGLLGYLELSDCPDKLGQGYRKRTNWAF
jgi:hypothetical protein